METAGYFAALLIGISLGLIGGGGSILTIPVLVYLFRIPPTLATGYSLFIVGCSSLVGAYKNFRKGHVNTRAALYFGITSILTVLLIRKWIVPAIPEHIHLTDSLIITKSLLTMLLFATVMIIAATRMIKKQQTAVTHNNDQHIAITKALIRGLETGILTGFLGAGGGFIIIPVLVLSFRLPMKDAIGTSLLIIAMNALFGFAVDVLRQTFNWRLLIILTLISIAGTFAGSKLGEKIPGAKLRKGFGWFVLCMGIYIILYELLS